MPIRLAQRMLMLFPRRYGTAFSIRLTSFITGMKRANMHGRIYQVENAHQDPGWGSKRVIMHASDAERCWRFESERVSLLA
jgi:hypothetical protein